MFMYINNKSYLSTIQLAFILYTFEIFRDFYFWILSFRYFARSRFIFSGFSFFELFPLRDFTHSRFYLSVFFLRDFAIRSFSFRSISTNSFFEISDNNMAILKDVSHSCHLCIWINLLSILSHCESLIHGRGKKKYDRNMIFVSS